MAEYFYCNFKMTGDSPPIVKHYGMRENGTFTLKRNEWKRFNEEDALNFKPRTYGATQIGAFVQCETGKSLRIKVNWPNWRIKEEREREIKYHQKQASNQRNYAIANFITLACVLTVIVGAMFK